MWEVGDGVDMWAQAVSGREKEEGARQRRFHPSWAGLGRKEEGEKGEGRAGWRGGGGEVGPAGRIEERRGKGNEFPFFSKSNFQIYFQMSFESF